jgi:hypothetical protein
VPGEYLKRYRCLSESTSTVICANWRGSSPTRSRLACKRSRHSRATPATAIAPWSRLRFNSRSIIRLWPSRSSTCERGGPRELLSLSEAMRLCHRLAQVDPTRASRVAASLGGPSPGPRGCAWAFVALGLAKNDRAGASEAIDRAIQEIDRLRESGPNPEPIGLSSSHLFRTNPAVLVLPIIERVAPERLTEFFWRAVALCTRSKTDRDYQLGRSNIGIECELLARYDRQVAAALLEPINASLLALAARSVPPDEIDPSIVTALGYIDPQSAVALLQALAPHRESRRLDPVNRARIKLAEVLGAPREDRWMRRWGLMTARFDE